MKFYLKYKSAKSNELQIMQQQLLKSIKSLALVYILILCCMQHYVAAESSSGNKGRKLAERSAKVAGIHMLEAVADSFPKNGIINNTTTNNHPTNTAASGQYEIRSVSGEPSYKSVNLTWEVEFVPTAEQNHKVGSSNDDTAAEMPQSFQLFYCELQSFGPHRCRSKLIDSETLPSGDSYEEETGLNDVDEIGKIKHVQHYATQVDNLRMATKYSFHIKPQNKNKHKKVTGRSEAFENEIEGYDFLSSNLVGQTIVIPTKGFSAQATQCLPNASEIEVETGPFFGGKIVVDGGNCGIKGDPNSSQDKYSMRIDHKICGSMLKPETNTVETFITVQENQGIFTHSTRRFVVVCSYQSGMQTVRASFTVPGRGGASAVHEDSLDEDERMGRVLKPMRFVDKSELILKEEPESNETTTSTTNSPSHNFTSSEESSEAKVEEIANPILQDHNSAKTNQQNDNETVSETSKSSKVTGNGIDSNESDFVETQEEDAAAQENGESKEKENLQITAKDGSGEIHEEVEAVNAFSANYAKLVLDHDTQQQEEEENEDGTHKESALNAILELIPLNMGGAMLTVLISLILIGVFVLVLYREINNGNSRPQMISNAQIQQANGGGGSSRTLPRHPQMHFRQRDSLPRTLLTHNDHDLMV